VVIISDFDLRVWHVCIYHLMFALGYATYLHV